MLHNQYDTRCSQLQINNFDHALCVAFLVDIKDQINENEGEPVKL